MSGTLTTPCCCPCPRRCRPELLQAPADPGQLQGLVGPVGERLQQAHTLADDRRSPAFIQAKLAAEALQALTWVVYTGPASGALLVLS